MQCDIKKLEIFIVITYDLQYRIEEMNVKVAIIDADLLGRTKHRFPNLVCEKLSAYWKERIKIRL